MTYGISEVHRVNIKFNTQEEYEKFNDWRFDEDNEIYPCNRGGMSGNLRHLGYYDKETAEKIKSWMQDNGGKFTPFLTQY